MIFNHQRNEFLLENLKSQTSAPCKYNQQKKKFQFFDFKKGFQTLHSYFSHVFTVKNASKRYISCKYIGHIKVSKPFSLLFSSLTLSFQ